MTTRLLTLVVPTYNRAECLSLLLTTLALELRGLEDKVEVIVGDNASTDRTPIVTEAFLKVCPSAQILRHSENLGPDENFCKCIDQVKTRFFWIIGDDDLPKTGVLIKIFNLLEFGDPDILYLNSEWMPHITGADDGEPITTLTTKVLSREGFAQQVNVWVTFISGMVVNLERLIELNPGLSTRRFTGTHLVQLGWVLPLLMTGNRFHIVAQRCVLATSGNTGGYAALTVFGSNFTKIVRENFGPHSEVTRAILDPHLTGYLPKLIWDTRFRSIGTFTSEQGWSTLREALGDRVLFWLLITPMLWLPKPLAWAFLFATRVVRRTSLKWSGRRSRNIDQTRATLVQPVGPSTRDRP